MQVASSEFILCLNIHYGSYLLVLTDEEGGLAEKSRVLAYHCIKKVTVCVCVVVRAVY
jgi:hypothetical protein